MTVDVNPKVSSERNTDQAQLSFDALINTIPSPVLVKDDRHRFVAVNTAFTAFFNRKAAEFIGRTDFDFFSPEDARWFQLTDRQALEQGRVVEYERTYSLDGTTHWMLVRKSRWVGTDRQRMVLALMINVTDRRAAEQALRQSEARFRALTELSADWYWEQDEQFRFTLVSVGAEDKTGHPAARSHGITRWDHTGIDFTATDWEQHKQDCLAHRPFRDFTYRRIGQDGRPRWIAVSGEPVLDTQQRFRGYQGIGRDVTVQRQITQETTRGKDFYAALSQTNRAIILIRDQQALFEEVCRVAVDYGHFCLVWLGLLDQKTGWVVPQAMSGPASRNYPQIRVSNDTALPEGRGYSSEALRTGERRVVNDYFADARVAPWASLARAAGVRSMATIPLKHEGRSIGLLNLHGDEVNFFSDELVALLQEMADNLSFALSNIQREKERDAAQRALAFSEQRFRQLASNIPEVFWIAEPGYRRLDYVSPAYEQVWGRSVQELLGNPKMWLSTVHPADRERVGATLRGPDNSQFDQKYRIVRPDGSVRWIHDRAFPLLDADGKLVLVTGIAKDITVQKEAEEQLMFLAHFDSLTGLPNRPLFYDRLQQSLAHSRRTGCITAVIFLDLDHFKRVNDTLGHASGDQLLRQVATRLKEALRTGDTIGRLGGDEFALILSDLARADDAALTAQKLMHVLEQPFRLDEYELFITASAGVTLAPDDGTDLETLIKNADTAMYRAKEMGRTNYQFYKSEINERSLERMSLEGQLRRALERNEFVLHYQPKVCLASGKISGVEALLRWQHPELGLVAPGRFIPILEDNGLIVQVGEWALGQVCRQLNLWEQVGTRVGSVALNLSARQFQQKGLESAFLDIVTHAFADPRQLELEITESVLMRNPDHAARILHRFKEAGMLLSVDDFGTGYSSLSYLKSFPLDALKIDRSFVKDIAVDADDAAIVQAVVALGKSLKLKTVAEGVEEAAQLAFLRGLGCDQYQGFYFSRPVPPEQITGLLANPPDS